MSKTKEQSKYTSVYPEYQKFIEMYFNSNPTMKSIIFHYPKQLVFGANSLKKMAEDYSTLGFHRFFIITIPSLIEQLSPILDLLKSKGISIQIHLNSKGEPTFDDFEQILSEAKAFNTDSFAGIGGEA